MARAVSIVVLVTLLCPSHLLAEQAATPPAPKSSIVLVTEDYPPFFAQHLSGKGWGYKVVAAALAKAGYAPQVRFVPWQRALKLSSTPIDGWCVLLGAFKTPERQAVYRFSRPFAAVRTGFFRHADREDIVFNGTLASVRRHVIGVGRGYSYGPAFDTATDLKKTAAADSATVLRMLYYKRVALAAGIREVDEHLLRTELAQDFPDIGEKLVFLEPPLAVNRLRLAVPHGMPGGEALVAAFDAALGSLVKNGRYAAVLLESGVGAATIAAQERLIAE